MMIASEQSTPMGQCEQAEAKAVGFPRHVGKCFFPLPVGAPRVAALLLAGCWAVASLPVGSFARAGG